MTLSEALLEDQLNRLNNISKWGNRAKGFAKFAAPAILEEALSRAYGVEDSGIGTSIARRIGANPDGLAVNLANLAGAFYLPTSLLGVVDAIDYKNQSQGKYDNAYNREIMQNVSDLDRAYEQEKLLYQDNPQLMQTFTDDYNNKKNLLLSKIDQNTPYQQHQQYVKELTGAMGTVVQAIAENSAPTEDFILSNDTQKGLASISKNNPKKVLYKDIDLNSELSRQILASNDYKRSYQDYADKNLSEEQKQIRAIADVMAYNNIHNA